jgi:DNA-binding HxlR family transcriptional regulator
VRTIAGVLSILGDRWALLVVREIALGVRRFDQLQSATGAPRQVLTDRLRRLTGAGVLDVREYRVPGHRSHSEYVLTDAGTDLLPVLAALSDWGERHLMDGAEGEPDIVYRHVGCGGRVRAVLQCNCGEPVGQRLIAQVNR